jgi:hypothetical protein
MRRTTLLFLLLFIAYATASAQAPILTASNAGPVTGDLLIKYYADTSGVLNGAPGASQTWDYSNLQLTGSSASYNYINPASAPAIASFPTATVVFNYSSVYSYQKLSSTDLTILGLSSSAYTMVYTDPEILCTFPFTYLGSITDSVKGSYTSGPLTFSRKGVRTTTADGWGTLMLPSGTYPNMLRMKIIQDYTDVTNVGGTTHVYNVIYNWYDAGHKTAAPEVFNSTNITSTDTLSGKYVTVSSAFASIDESVSFQNMISFEPNPVRDHLTLTINGQTTAFLQISNLSGQIVGGNTFFENNARIDLSTLPSGIYILKATTGEGSCVKKFVKL